MVKKKNFTLQNILYLVLFFISLVLFVFTISFKRDSPSIKSIRYLKDVEISVNNGQWENKTLPLTFNHLNYNDKISVRTTITPHADDGVYISSDYVHADVFLDNKQVFSLGKMENYPPFMIGPAKEIHVVETYGKEKPVDLQIDYIIPDDLRSMVVEVPMVGTSKEIILERSVRYGLSWIFALTQIIGGLSTLLVSVCLLFVDKKGILFTWLGLFAFSSGLWFFGINGFSITVFPHSAWLYTMSHIGFIFSMLPLMRLLILSVGFENEKPVLYLENFYGIAVLVSITLQLFKLYSLHTCIIGFKILISAYLLILTLFIIYEKVVNKNKYAGHFILPMSILFLADIAETLNYFVFNETAHIALFYQTGIFIFLLIMVFLAGVSLKTNVDFRKREEALKHQEDIISMITEEQRERSLALAKNENKISRQRHDLRHHISAIMELSDGNKMLEEYLSTLIDNIPPKREQYCQNNIVNAILSHYAALYESENIEFTTVLDIPDLEDISINTDLCVIISNMLENAFEACTRMDTFSNRFIEIKSSLTGGILTITMDNSFNGVVTKVGEKYKSSKRNDFGIGLASIRSVCRHYHGDANFTHNDKIFYSSVYLSIL